MHDAKAFICHSSTCKPAALALRDELGRLGIHAWVDDHELPFGTELATRIRTAITEADHVLVLLNKAATTSPWVARELGLALELRQTRKTKHPAIIGVRPTAGCGPLQIVPRDFATGAPADRPFDFEPTLWFRPTPEGVARLAEQLRPRVMLFEDAGTVRTPICSRTASPATRRCSPTKANATSRTTS
jgi:hypothetical protein